VYLENHRWARCVLFTAGAVGLGGSYALALREAAEAGKGAQIGKALWAVAKGTSTPLGTTSSLSIVAQQLTGGCIG
jgi:hypothetical protein